MVITDIGAVAEKVYDVELRELWHNPGYFLEVVAPGSRYESDFRVGVIIYRTATNAEGGLMLKCIGHVKVDERELRSLEIPGFFLKIGSRIREYLAGHNGINLK